MFAGIVEGTREITELKSQPDGASLGIDLNNLAEDVSVGDSVAVDGVCLTATQAAGTIIQFNVITETLRKTTLGGYKVGDNVNVERSLRAGDRIHGHFVQGHVFSTGKIVKREETAEDFKLWIEASEAMKYVAPVGSIAINGVSLTVADVLEDMFSVALIPTTLELTNLGSLREGDIANLEPDMVARQVVQYLNSTQAS